MPVSLGRLNKQPVNLQTFSKKLSQQTTNKTRTLRHYNIVYSHSLNFTVYNIFFQQGSLQSRDVCYCIFQTCVHSHEV